MREWNVARGNLDVHGMIVLKCILEQYRAECTGLS